MSEGRFAVEPAALQFGAAVNAGRATGSPPQTIFLETDQGERLTWHATASAPWLEVKPASGTTPGAIRVSILADRLPLDASVAEGSITLTAGTTTVTVPVVANMAREGQASVGAVDLPADHARSAPGPIRFSGWALDDIAISRIEISRNGAPLATASPYAAARPDVAALYPGLPHAERSGWSVVLDTTRWPRAAQGTFRVQIIAHDAEGHATAIGTRSLTVDPAAAAPREWPLMRAGALLGLALAAAMLHLLLRRQFLKRRAFDAWSRTAPAIPVSQIEWLAIAAIVVLAAVLALRSAGGLGYDELYTYTHFVGRLPPWAMASALGVGVFNNHVAYSWLASVAVSMLGASDFSLRLPAAVLGTLSVAAVWQFTRTFAPRSAALLAALLLALSPMHIAWSHAARGYTGLSLMALVSSAAFFRLLERPSGATALVHAVATAAGIYFHLYAVWVAGIQYVIFGWMAMTGRLAPESFRRLWQSFLGAGALVALLYGPVLVLLIDIMGGTAARARTAIQPAFPLELFDAVTGSASVWARIAAAVLTISGVIRLRHRALHAGYILLLLCVPLLTVWLLLRPSDLYPRFFHFWTPAACVLMAIAVTGAKASRWSASRTFAGIAAGALLVVIVAGWIPRSRLADVDNGYRGALSSLKEEAGKTRTVLFGPDAGLLRYYLGSPAPVVDSADQIDQMMRDDPSPLLVVEHSPGWQAAEHARIGRLLSRRCVSSREGSIVTYRCALAGPP